MIQPIHSEMQGRHVLVTGAGSGIGLACARILLREGAKVAAVLQDASQMPWAQSQLPGAVFLLQDLSDAQACMALPERAAHALGALDALACCAGVFFKKTSDETTLDEWQHTLDINLSATFLITRAAIAHMRHFQALGASVVVITSQIDLVGHARGAAYAASKAGLNGMVKSLALEWAQQGVRINAVGPGPIQTGMVAAAMNDPEALAAIEQSIPMGRLGQPEEIGELVSFLLSSRSAFITGQVVCADGGFTAR